MKPAMQEEFMDLRSVLRQADNLIWSDALYMPRDHQWSLDTPCILHDVDDVEDDEQDLPKRVIEHGFDYVLGVQAVQDIVVNARLQINDPTDEQLFDAFTFYFKNDAFIRL